MTAVLPRTRTGERFAGKILQSECVNEFAVCKQPRIGRYDGAAKLHRHAATTIGTRFANVSGECGLTSRDVANAPAHVHLDDDRAQIVADTVRFPQARGFVIGFVQRVAIRLARAQAKSDCCC
jgi:hypothetical protein